MFTLIGEIYNLLFSPRQYNLLICGVDGAGKTRILNAFKRNFTKDLADDLKIIPTTGLNRKQSLIQLLIFNSIRLWDMGGRESIRSIWSHYYPQTHGLIYVIDPAQIKNRHSQIMQVLKNLLKQQDLQNIPICFILNNRTHIEQQKLSELKKYLRMLMQNRIFTIFNFNNLNKQQLLEVLKWNEDKLIQISKSLNY